MGKMEIFTELIKREPGLLDKPLKDLVPISYIGTAAVKSYEHLLARLDTLDIAEEQKETIQQNASEASDMLMDITRKIGELLPPPDITGSGKGIGRITGQNASGKIITIEDKESRLPEGITPRDAHIARQFAERPDIVEKVKARARDEKDVASKNRVMTEIKHEKEKIFREETKKETKQTKAEMTLEQVKYVNTIEWIIEKLPKEPPKNWNEKSFQYVQGLTKIIFRRLEGFKDERANNPHGSVGSIEYERAVEAV